MSKQLLQAIVNSIKSSKHGYISFADFMQQALYHPKFGYYNNNSEKFGPKGDFITAPTIGPYYGNCLAKQCNEILNNINGDSILEFGAGSGDLAATILPQAKIKHYYIVELSASLKKRQRDLIKQKHPELYNKVIWINYNELKDLKIKGVILANEVLDAMPVTCFRIANNKIYERVIILDCNNNLQWDIIDAHPRLKNNINENLLAYNNITYNSEVNLNVSPWLNKLNNILEVGVALIIDYGYAAREYYHIERTRGTLMCYFQHKKHDNPFINIGSQDITAHVDFSLVADLAVANNFTVEGFTNQAAFLLSLGILDDNQLDKNIAHTLVSPNHMGELFKVIAIGKKYDGPLQGMDQLDLSYQL